MLNSNRCNPEIGGGKFYTGAVFPPGGNSILTLKIGGKYMLGRFFPPWGKFYPGPVFPGGKTMRGESLCYNTVRNIKFALFF